MSDITQYLESLKEIEHDQLFITESLDKIDTEISENCWSISLTQQLASLITLADLLNFLDRIKLNRKEQIFNGHFKLTMLFYLWFDEQACQLKFNFINSNHPKLPFNCGYKLIEKPNEIIELFISSNCQNEAPFVNLEDTSDVESISLELLHTNLDTNNDLKVYSEIISCS